jgi:hypothetical protein
MQLMDQTRTQAKRNLVEVQEYLHIRLQISLHQEKAKFQSALRMAKIQSATKMYSQQSHLPPASLLPLLSMRGWTPAAPAL